MLASVHVADVGARAGLATLLSRRAPSAPGLRWANLALAARLASSRRRPPELGRIALFAFWDDDASLDAFLASHPVAARFDGGWQMRMRPLRVYGSWPGLPADLPTTRNVDAEGPFAVLTLGRLQLKEARRFLRTTARAEQAAVASPGMIWGTASAKPPFVATCSLWASARGLAEYAFGPAGQPHPDAIAADRAKAFHHQSAFIRFTPYRSEGQLTGSNPLAATWLQDHTVDKVIGP